MVATFVKSLYIVGRDATIGAHGGCRRGPDGAHRSPGQRRGGSRPDVVAGVPLGGRRGARRVRRRRLAADARQPGLADRGAGPGGLRRGPPGGLPRRDGPRLARRGTVPVTPPAWRPRLGSPPRPGRRG